MISFQTGIVTQQPQASSGHAARAEPRNDNVIVFDRKLGPYESRLANELYDQLKGERHNGSDQSWRCEVKDSFSDTLVGFQKPGEEPVIIQVHDKTKTYIGSGVYGLVYESSHLLRNAEGAWGVPEGDKYKRVMKIQETSDNALSEIDFHLEQRGTLGAGRVGYVQYLDQLRLPGNCLENYFKDENWPLKERFECAVAMVECAQRYLAGGKVHPDIKPDNMIYDRFNKEISFIDNAHVQDLEAPTAVQVTVPTGTPRYIAPEQYLEMDFSGKSMVYSLGIIMLNLFSEKPHEYEVACSGVTQDMRTKLYPEKILPKLRQTSPEFVQQLQGSLIEMVSDIKENRPDLDSCMAHLTAFESAYKLIEDSERKIKLAEEQVQQLNLQLYQLKQRHGKTDNDAKINGQIEQLQKELFLKETIFQHTLEQQEGLVNEMEEKLKKTFEEERETQRLEFEKLQKTTKELEEQSVHYKKIAEQKESDVQQANRQVQELTDVVKKMKGEIVEVNKQKRNVDEACVRAEEGRTKAEERSSKYELELQTKKNAHQIAMCRLSITESEKNKLKAEKASQAKRVQELSIKLSENLKAPLDRLKSLASNRDGLDSTEFGKNLPGVLAAQQFNSVKISYLNDLAKTIFCNVPADGLDKPYVHKFSYLRPFSIYTRRQQVDFTETQLMHLGAVVSEAKVLAKTMLNGNDESKREACHFLNKGFAARVQVTDVLSRENGWAESLLASTPEITKYQFTPEEIAKYSKSCLCKHFKDGREGDPDKSKQLTDVMTGLEKLEEVSAAKSLLNMLRGNGPVCQLYALENEFLSILTRPNAYTRGEQDTVAWLAESMLKSVTGERHIRQDVDSPSATKMRHIVLLRSAYDEALKTLMEEKEEKLNSIEVTILADSRLVNFSPAQYQHELQGFKNDLKYKVTTLLESEKNIAAYKDYLHKTFAADFSAYSASPDIS